MCFKNLPVEFDDSGKARLKEGVGDAYEIKSADPKSYVRRQEGPGAKLAARVTSSGLVTDTTEVE